MESHWIQATSKVRTCVAMIVAGTAFYIGASLGLALSTPSGSLAAGHGYPGSRRLARCGYL